MLKSRLLFDFRKHLDNKYSKFRIDMGIRMTDLEAFVIEDAEKHIDQQIKMAVAFDLRSMTFATGFFLVSSTVFGSLLQKVETQIYRDHLILLGGYAMTCVSLYTAAMICAYTARPSKISSIGSEPKCWSREIRQKKALCDCFDDIVDIIQTRIDNNNSLMNKNAKIFKIGLYAGLTAPLMGLLASCVLYVITIISKM